ncbi:hypothetical protein BGW80DRAFT_1275273 [Lactifluus volemus]|nr:hypothetical protein BGW80DRAFT_1275273 [Lactifluus volemus]
MKYFLSSPMTSRLNFWQAILPIGYGSQFTVVHARNSYLLSSGRCASFQGRKGQKALAMHWGIWVLTAEPVLEPPELLREESVRSGVEADDFLVPALGETVLF